jgi:hypothetical protein
MHSIVSTPRQKPPEGGGESVARLDRWLLIGYLVSRDPRWPRAARGRNETVSAEIRQGDGLRHLPAWIIDCRHPPEKGTRHGCRSGVYLSGVPGSMCLRCNTKPGPVSTELRTGKGLTPRLLSICRPVLRPGQPDGRSVVVREKRCPLSRRSDLIFLVSSETRSHVTKLTYTPSGCALSRSARHFFRRFSTP